MALRRPARLGDGAYRGGERIFFTMCTFHRCSYFEISQCVHLSCEQLLRTSEECDLEIIVYSFMPDHLHALTSGRSIQADAKEWAAAFRAQSAFHHRRQHRQRIWQDGYPDHNLRDHERTLDYVRYTIENPVRAGLCAKAEAYPYTGSTRYSVESLVESARIGRWVE